MHNINMAKFNYQTICSNLLRDLSPRTRDVLVRRFGLRGAEGETLEATGKKYGITRERTRQIEEDGLGRVRDLAKTKAQNVFQHFASEIRSSGSLRKEDVLTSLLGGPKFKNHVLFLLALNNQFERSGETKDFHFFWAVDRQASARAQKAIDLFISQLKAKNRPMALPSSVLPAYVEISKHVLAGSDGLYGLRDWPEINPRGIKDRAYIVVKKEKKPLHFTRVACSIGKKALPQTVHNELIKDSRFVLVGRGLYALKEWGYEPGTVREVIAGVLRGAKRSAPKEDIVRRVLKQRCVKENTVLLNLQNKKYFSKDSQGNYRLREA